MITKHYRYSRTQKNKRVWMIPRQEMIEQVYENALIKADGYDMLVMGAPTGRVVTVSLMLF